MKHPQWFVWKCFKQYVNERFMSIVCSPMLSLSKLTYFKWNTVTAVLMWTEAFSLNSKKMHFVKFQFCMLYINFWSEHLSVQFDGICFSTIYIFCMNTITQLIISFVLHSHQFATNIFWLTWNSQKISHHILDH